MIGVVIFYDKSGNIIFHTISNNIQKSIEKYSSCESYEDLQKKSSKMTKHIFANLFDALVFQKDLKTNTLLLKQYQNYAYLAIDPHNSPQLSITEDTNSKKEFVGPFRNRFILCDIVDKFSELFSLPKMTQKIEKIDSNILECFLNKKILEPYHKNYQRLYRNLEFQRAENLRSEYHLIQKYFDILNFIKKSKNLDFSFIKDEKKYIVKNGLLFKKDSKFYNSNFNLEYRKNEKFALNKDELDEREIIYHQYLAIQDQLKSQKSN